MARTILIIDDEKNLADLIAHQLKSRGYYTVTAANGQEGLDKLKAIIPDLIILDVNMPVMNGLDFYRQIMTETGRTPFPVLILTSRQELEKTFQDVQAAGFLPKPFLIEDLIREVEKITAGVNKPAVFLFEFDDTPHHQKIRQVLSRNRYEVCDIKDLGAFKELAAGKPPRAIIFEYGRTDHPGAEILREIRNTAGTEHCPVIAYSYAGREEFERESLAAGADKYLSAPARYEVFAEALQELRSREE